MNANRVISLAFGLLALGVLALGWMLGVAPKLAEASRADTERAGVEAQNAVHEVRLAELAAQYERIDELRAEVEELAVFLPDEHLLEDFLDRLNSAAATTEVVLREVTMGEPQPAEEAGEGPALIAIPVTVAVIGPLPAGLAFTELAQSADRVFVVNGLAFDSSRGETVLTGMLFVVADANAPAEQ